MVEKCREITENDPKLAEMRSNLEGNIDEKEEVTTFLPQIDEMNTTSLRLTKHLIGKLGQFVGASDKFEDRSALVRAILSRFFNENDPVSTEFRKLLQ